MRFRLVCAAAGLLAPHLLFLIPIPSRACSSAVISGAATPDGRPLLWKHRDTREEANDLRYFKGAKYDFVGVVDTKDTSGTQVWMGSNSAGFSIMNTNAYNLPKGDYHGKMDQDGFLMKEALDRCATVDDFQRYLDETAGQRGVIANFGVIDARGGAAFFEVTPFTYERYDATDPKVAPEGYLLRTNFGFSGKTDEGSGYVRYQTLEPLFLTQREKDGISVDFLLLTATRCLQNSVLHTDLRLPLAADCMEGSRYVVFRDYVVQHSSVSTLVVQGVKPGEDWRLTTLWTIPAFQLTSPCVPVWVAGGEPLPLVAVSRGGGSSFITENALALKKRCFPLPGRDGGNYIDPSIVFDGHGDGFLEKVLRRDTDTLAHGQELLATWRAKGFDPDAAQQFYNWLDEKTRSFYDDANPPQDSAPAR